MYKYNYKKLKINIVENTIRWRLACTSRARGTRVVDVGISGKKINYRPVEAFVSVFFFQLNPNVNI